MYWSKINIKSTLAGLLLSCSLGFQSCSTANPPLAIIEDHELFDLPLFIQNQIDSLNIANPLVLKSVSKDQHSEEKTMHIDSWEIELSSLKSVDLRKGAYKGFIRKDSTNNKVTYTFESEDVDLSKVEISYLNEMPTQIEVERKVNNLLYDTVEKLSYAIGKTYYVEKVQNVWILGENNYVIKGTIQ